MTNRGGERLEGIASTEERWWRPFRETGDSTVVYVDLQPDATREGRASAWLDEGERARWRRFGHERPRRQFVLCRAALRALLCRRLDCGNDELSFGAAKHGKLFALVGGVPASASFNVSHSGEHGLIAFASRGRIGVDVEKRTAGRDLDGIAERVFAPGERAQLAALAGERKVRLFFSLWTMKEALLKALGTGLSLDSRQFEVPPALRREARIGIFRFPHAPGVEWRLERLGDARFAAALAHELDR